MPVFFTKEIKDKNEKYTDLDGAGIIYPYVANKDWNSVYRVEARLKTTVDFTKLEDAVKIMRNKYPYFFSRISTHGKKYVLKRAYCGNIIYKSAPICKPFDIKNDETLLRVVYTERTIGVEFFHGLTDGHGAQCFFNELLKEYFNIVFSKSSYDSPLATDLPINQSLLDTNDIYNDIYNLGGKGISRFLSKAYQFDNKGETQYVAKSIAVSSSLLKLAAHRHNASITEYLCAVQIATIFQTQRVKSKPVRISVPVDIRKFFEFTSARNASLYFLVEIKPNNISDFDSLIKSVKKQFEQALNKENMQNLAYSNVKCAKMKAYNLLPIPLKKIALNIGYTKFGENQFTSTITNLGVVRLDSRAENVVSSVYYMLGKEKTKPLNLAVTTYDNETRILVSSTIDSTKFINTMCEIFLADGIVSTITAPTEPIKFNKSIDKVS